MNGVLIPAQYGVIFIPLAQVQVKAGDTLRLTCRYSHIGLAETKKLYAAIGNSGWAGFDEVLYGQRSISVPEDSGWSEHEEYVDISITSAISPGTYDLYAKIDGVSPEVISPVLNDVVVVVEEVPESEFGEVSIVSYEKV